VTLETSGVLDNAACSSTNTRHIIYWIAARDDMRVGGNVRRRHVAAFAASAQALSGTASSSKRASSHSITTP
jgi:hypothetical protein